MKASSLNTLASEKPQAPRPEGASVPGRQLTQFRPPRELRFEDWGLSEGCVLEFEASLA